MTDKREQLAKFYNARFAYFQKHFPEFDPQVLETHLNIIRTSDMIWQALRAYLRPHGLTPPSMGALAMLDSAGEPMAMNQLSEQMIVTQANVTGIVDTLEKSGLVRRQAHPGDRRITLVEITPTGHAKIKKFLPGQLQLVRKIYGDLKPPEHKNIRAALEKIRSGIKMLGKSLLPILFCTYAVAAPASPKSLPLNIAVSRTLASHPSLQAARSAYDQARAVRWRALGIFDLSLSGSLQHLDAKTPPSLFFQTPRTVSDSGDLTLSKNFLYGTQATATTGLAKAKDLPGTAFNLNPRVDSSLNLAVSQPLLKGFLGLPDKMTLRAADFGVRAARATLERATEKLAERTVNVYWELWAARGELKIAERSTREAREFLTTTRKLRKRYQAEQDDLLRAEAELLRSELDTLAAQRRIDDGGERLRELMTAATVEIENSTLEDPREPTPAPDLAQSRAKALISRRDLAARRSEVERDKLTLDGAAGLGLPALDLSAGLGWAGLKKQPGASIGQLTRLGFRTWSIGLDFSYAFGARIDRAERLSLTAAHALSTARTVELRKTIERDVALAIRRLRLAGQTVRLARRLQTMQDDILKLTAKKYGQGRVSSRDRLQGANAALAARSVYVDARAQWALSQAATQAAQGTLLEWLGLAPSEVAHP